MKNTSAYSTMERKLMNEAETRAEYIDPQLKALGWGEVEGSRVLREFRITDGKIEVGGKRSKNEREGDEDGEAEGVHVI